MTTITRDRAVELIGLQDVALAERAPVIAYDPIPEDAPDDLPNPTEIGWGDNFHVLCRGLANHVSDPEWITGEVANSFLAQAVEDFLEWEGAEDFLQQQAELLQELKSKFEAADIVDKLRGRFFGYIKEAKQTKDWDREEQQQHALNAMIPHRLGLQAVEQYTYDTLAEPMTTLAQSLQASGYHK